MTCFLPSNVDDYLPAILARMTSLDVSIFNVLFTLNDLRKALIAGSFKQKMISTSGVDWNLCKSRVLGEFGGGGPQILKICKIQSFWHILRRNWTISIGLFRHYYFTSERIKTQQIKPFNSAWKREMRYERLKSYATFRGKRKSRKNKSKNASLVQNYIAFSFFIV